ncbi:GGDEF domain-containing protein [Paraburkholderia bryophila]|uniref:diguanylate cyclase n=1 Tax=Paraburkholderia bryophila TaxID=420952 RepID=A0A329BX40_9BURK|nr:GGDEF domain-containing protein [Paraburkholderia bryophila]RAS26430.1 diguanylate cyclase (GGDEF)-like protein [Paraburkholderia bryophila]
MLDPAVAVATAALMSLVLLVLLGSLLRSGMPGVREWFAANLGIVVALPLILMRGSIPEFLSVVIANLVMALSAVTYYAGCAQFLGRPARWPLLSASLAPLGIALIYWRYVVDSIPVRVLATTLFTAAVCLATAYLVVRYRPRGRSAYPYWVTAAMALLFALCQLARGVYFMTLNGVSNPVMFASTGSVILLVAATAIMPTLSMSAMMMVHNVLLADARDAANRDFLTGALSRKGFEAIARTRLEEADRHGLPVSLLIVDLDHFKSINDTFGHAGGDTVLREFVRVAHLQLRRSDALGRLGGEEFAVLLPATQPDDALRFAERLRQAVAAQPVTTVGGPCAYSISGGLAGWMPGETLDRLSARSDLALYDAKRAGRDRICVHQPGTHAAGKPSRDSAEPALAR